MNKNFVIIIVVLLLVVVVTLKSKGMVKLTPYNKVPKANITDVKMRKAFEVLRDKFKMTKEESKNLEQLTRKETRHFDSGQFLRSLSPGMEAFGLEHPFGWHSLNRYFWNKNPKYAPKSLYVMPENTTGIKKKFLRFANIESGLLAVLMNARMKNGMFEKWRSNDSNVYNRYKDEMGTINTPLTNQIY